MLAGAPPRRRRLSSICNASSRVGARISARVAKRRGVDGRAGRCCSIGSAKAAVLPVPVWATPSRSRPSSRGGMAWPGWGSVRGNAYFEGAQKGSARPRGRKLVDDTKHVLQRRVAAVPRPKGALMFACPRDNGANALNGDSREGASQTGGANHAITEGIVYIAWILSKSKTYSAARRSAMVPIGRNDSKSSRLMRRDILLQAM